MQAAEAGLGVSMMERLQAAGLEVQVLTTQYRMHPVLAAWPSAAFYGNRLLSHPTPAERQPPKGDFPFSPLLQGNPWKAGLSSSQSLGTVMCLCACSALLPATCIYRQPSPLAPAKLPLSVAKDGCRAVCLCKQACRFGLTVHRQTMPASMYGKKGCIELTVP